ncbi:MAG: hypothetical protein A3J38_02875 [Gammaproteobacteria bacterium RIFCSPHIGHO2_12_FULL_45_9]|nr:MAG: hypothetical protein A3J38_02875 [Gammaproteobacteria bacterium RIFCSPHIGHO2_12_FULL_45_9]
MARNQHKTSGIVRPATVPTNEIMQAIENSSLSLPEKYQRFAQVKLLNRLTEQGLTYASPRQDVIVFLIGELALGEACCVVPFWDTFSGRKAAYETAVRHMIGQLNPTLAHASDARLQEMILPMPTTAAPS